MCAVLQERGNLGCFTRLSLNVKQTAPFELMELDLLTLENKYFCITLPWSGCDHKITWFLLTGPLRKEQTACSGSFWGSEASLNPCSEAPCQLLNVRAGNLLSFNQE